MKYFDLFDDMRSPTRWLLASPVDDRGQEVNPWQFGKGLVLDLKSTLRIAQCHPGQALDFSLADVGVPVVHGRGVSMFEQLGLQQQVQFFPAHLKQALEEEGITGLRFTRVSG